MIMIFCKAIIVPLICTIKNKICVHSSFSSLFHFFSSTTGTSKYVVIIAHWLSCPHFITVCAASAHVSCHNSYFSLCQHICSPICAYSCSCQHICSPCCTYCRSCHHYTLFLQSRRLTIVSQWQWLYTITSLFSELRWQLEIKLLL